MRWIRTPVETVGKNTVETVELVGGISSLATQATAQARVLAYRGRPGKMARDQLAAQMVRVGVRSIPIVSLVVFCIGLILALQIVPVLAVYGAQRQIADIIAIAMFRELGPLVGAIVLTGFAGASIAAEIGTMKVSEEIEALETHAIDPVRFLVLPRVFATAIMTLCLAVIANGMGLLGGMTGALMIADMSATAYLSASFNAVDTTDLFTGLFKAIVFGAVIALLACHLGLKVTNGAEGVGNATTRTVVMTVVSLTLIDLLFTAVFYRLDL